ncbi:hypothetical protein TrVE_jg11954 [Triparma verrucosa]|uniref:Uncharacterized protein n=1 Tax=Triparma verrucosa TaxID=1606542 RepID=A0A9W7C3M6_9STRA|nr:hypothetical protein TrVE_jg11954 [Triparma verrucosa]
MANDMANYSSNHNSDRDSNHDSDTDSDAAPRPSYLDSPLAVDDDLEIGHDVEDPRVEWDDEINVQINQGRMQQTLKKVYERDRDEGCYFYVNKYAKSNEQSNEQSNDDNGHVYNYNNTANIWMDFDNNTNTNDTNDTTQIASATATPLLPLIFYLSRGPSNSCDTTSLISYVLLYVKSYIDCVKRSGVSVIVSVTLDTVLEEGLEFRMESRNQKPGRRKLNNLGGMIIAALSGLTERGLVAKHRGSALRLSSTGLLVLLEQRENILAHCEEIDRMNIKSAEEHKSSAVLRSLGEKDFGVTLGCSLDVCDPGWRAAAADSVVECRSESGRGRRTPTYFVDSKEETVVQPVEWKLTKNEAFFNVEGASGKRLGEARELMDDDGEEDGPVAFKRMRRGRGRGVGGGVVDLDVDLDVDAEKIKTTKLDDGDSCSSNDWSSAEEDEKRGYGGLEGFVEGGEIGEDDVGEGEDMEVDVDVDVNMKSNNDDNDSDSDSEELVGSESDSSEDDSEDDSERKKWDDDSLGDSDSDSDSDSDE